MKNKVLFLIIILIACNENYSQVPNYVKTNKLIGWWNFNGNANNQASSNYSGVNSNSVLSSDRFGISNSAYSFDGINSNIQFLNLPFNMNDSFTLSFWMKLKRYDDLAAILELTNNNNACNRNVHVYLYNSMLQNANCGENPLTANWGKVGDSNSLKTNFHHIVLIKSLSQNNFKIFRDNVLVSTLNNVSYVNDNSTNMIIGAALNGGMPKQFSRVDIDDIGLWNRELTICEINDLFVAKLSCNISSSINNQSTHTTVLNQNFPNPFDQKTSIEYKIPQNCKTAVMNFVSIDGRLIKTVALDAKEKNILIISSTDFPRGIYYYSLIADGIKLDTKKMVVQ